MVSSLQKPFKGEYKQVWNVIKEIWQLAADDGQPDNLYNSYVNVPD